jgi:hypothetical protein
MFPWLYVLLLGIILLQISIFIKVKWMTTISIIDDYCMGIKKSVWWEAKSFLPSLSYKRTGIWGNIAEY